jgi:hypothetical protein
MRVSEESIQGRGDEGERGEALRVERGLAGRVSEDRQGESARAGKEIQRGQGGGAYEGRQDRGEGVDLGE